MTQEIEEVRAPELPGEAEVAEGRSLSALADVCREQGRYDEAETLYRRALDIVDEVLGHDHLEAADLYLNLGKLEQARGRAAEGEALMSWGLAIRERHERHGEVGSARV